MKNILKIIIIFIAMISLTGCIKKDNFEDINIYTTIHTIEYITNELYSEYSTINSIYPDGKDISEYIITNKKMDEFSNSDLFIYNGLSAEKQIAATLINKNKKINIIDVSQGLEIKDEETELWISPSNCLMIAQNIKNGLKEYVTNTSILESIDQNYENLKIQISEFDAELKLIAENATNKNIIVANSSFDFLKKYGFEVLNISYEDEELSTTSFSKAKNAFSSNENSYLFVLQGTDTISKDIKDLIDNGAKIVTINSMVNLTDEERENDKNYMTFMKEFIDAIKTEVY
ncbi:MAG: zinc ABC transporter substrate-binding protein [Bacilli bacterium]|nr:zinc ABC transporter substrate-binding protein [Bacilli bacterium]